MPQYIVFRFDGKADLIEAESMQAAIDSLDYATVDHITRMYPEAGDTFEKLVRKFSERTGWKHVS
jgi:hypothetical protein